MAKSKRSSLKPDAFFLKAFRPRGASDASRKSPEPPQSLDDADKRVLDSPASRATIKLVEPSPPQSAKSTSSSRSVSMEPEKNVAMMESPISKLASPQTGRNPPKATPSRESTINGTHRSSNLPIYDQFQSSAENEEETLSRTGSSKLSPTTPLTNNRTSSITSATNDEGVHWSSNVRTGGSSGKSSRVIEKLTSENSRLHRELNEKTARLEEAQRTHETDKISSQEARESAMRHKHMYETNQAILIRRDRKVEELKETLAAEKARREKAEKERQEMADLLREESSRTARELQIEQEKRLYFQTQYEVVEKAYMKGRMPWEPVMAKLRKDMDTVHAMIHNMVLDQDSRDAARARSDELTKQYVAKVNEYKELKKSLLGPWNEKIRQQEEAGEKLLEDMTATRDKMRWVMAVKKNVKDAR